MTRFSIAVLCLCFGLWFLHLEPQAVSASTRDIESATPQSLEKVVSLLETSAAGKTMIEKAMRVWNLHSREELFARLKWGSVSKTDAVLIRHYDEETGKESRERIVTVYLRQNQPVTDVMLDLAHELVHATAKPSWDPYDPALTAGSYIHAAIEGEGGEVEAVRVECLVSYEIFGDRSNSLSAARCNRYAVSDQKVAADRIRKDFYRVGHWMKDLSKRLGSEGKRFPDLSEKHPTLYSSTGGTPYPVALYEEYRQMTAAACENTRRRAPASVLASDTPTASNAELAGNSSAQRFLASRCK